MDDILQTLNPEQRKPVEDTEGAVLVIAGAGSGKTRVLTGRIASLVGRGVPPERILAITFTNKAADEMRERISKMVDGAENMWVSTIHSMCVRILRVNAELLGYNRNFSIYSEQDKDRVVKRVYDSYGFDDEKLLKNAKFAISEAKTAGLSPDEYASRSARQRYADEIYKIYARYEEELRKSNAMDFDDLLVRTRDLLAGNRDVLEKYADRFLYVHVDEFQDVNAVQYEIVRLLASKHGNIFVVGDDDQSIYGWRGAEIKNILGFEKDFRGAKVYKLEQNYRSTKRILDIANAVIERNSMRKRKKLWTNNDEGDPVRYFDGRDETEEAAFAAREIRSLVDGGACRYRGIAVLMRVNALSRAYEQEFAKYGIPFRVYGGFRFFERKEIKDLIAYLRLLANPLDDESLLRVINVPKRAIGKKSVDDLLSYARANGFSAFEAVTEIDSVDTAAGAKKRIGEFRRLIVRLIAEKETMTLSDLLESLIASTDFMSQFTEDTEENVNKRMNVAEFRSSVAEFERLNPGATLSDYLGSVTLSSDTDDIETDDAVSLATVHAVKGLEFDAVFVCGLDEKVFPISRAENSAEESEEERRLMYVAVTRARRRLYLTRAHSRYLFGDRQYTVESRFIRELAPKLGIDLGRSSAYGGYGAARGGYGYGGNYGNGYQNRGNGYGNYGNGYGNRGAREYGTSRGESSFSSRSGSGGFASSFLEERKRGPAGGGSASGGSAGGSSSSGSAGGYRSGAKVRHAKFGEGTVIAVRGSGSNLVADVAFRGFGVKTLAVSIAPMELIDGE